MRKIVRNALYFLILGSLAMQAQSGRRVQIINRSSSSIEYLHASNSEHPQWDSDLLGPMRLIAPGRSVDVRIDDGTGHCRYDLRAILLDGREAEQPDFDVCANISWTVNATADADN
ncbi:MAG TPA: hypothetical protein VHY84_06945 [Bryobacteraceae bacterium]|jgi:hypothetical protein|nr:hypothetical protein [Bryobacteraceae bacterium]